MGFDWHCMNARGENQEQKIITGTSHLITQEEAEKNGIRTHC